MATVFTVQSDSEAECRVELERLCRDYGLVPALLPREWSGTGRWMARATPKAPAEVHGGQAV
ncbi:hypothetical protein [Streptomyces sp. NBC_01353]|uniref:hypothetical protein n=1 Tax=Streptomyces sp. NBC_01353 TaxID=2903835 RepID=UPI002E33B505|nr:hypothetical protein [Streptomyces sp. NBC_01353]